MYAVNYHWDQLKTCVVGKTYPANFYQFIADKSIRNLMETVANETEQDLEYLCQKLNDLDVEVIRPQLNSDYQQYKIGQHYLPAPLTPRDDMAMIGSTFYMTKPCVDAKYQQLRGNQWPINAPVSQEEFDNLPPFVREELLTNGIDSLAKLYIKDFSCYANIADHVTKQGNVIEYNKNIDSAMVCRLGNHLYCGTWYDGHDELQSKHMQSLFPNYHCTIINSRGHLDGTICPVCPGLVIASRDISQLELQRCFPNWEIFYVDSFSSSQEFAQAKKLNGGQWWITGQQNLTAFSDYVEIYFKHWLGNAAETSIDVNMLIVNPQNIFCSRYNQALFDKLESYGLQAHVVPLRHSNFWDGGLHCVTNDLDRQVYD